MNLTSQQIRQFINKSGITLMELKALTGLSASQIMSWLAGEEKIFREKNLNNLEKSLCTKISNLSCSKQLNEYFYKNIRGENVIISDYYAEESKSFVRSSAHIIKYLELLFGVPRVACVLKAMSVHRAYFNELDNKINILFFIDLLEKCREMGVEMKDLRKIASAMFLSIEGTDSENLFPQCTLYSEVYANIREVVGHFDSNFYYDFKINETTVEIIAEPHESIVSCLEIMPLDYLMYYRRQIFGTVPLLCGVKDIVLELEPVCDLTSMSQKYIGRFPRSRRSGHLQLIGNKFS